jgi:hypothetical protein
MNIPKSFIKTRFIEIGRTIIHKPTSKSFEFYKRKISWWIYIYGVRFKHVGYYIMLKKTCI